MRRTSLPAAALVGTIAAVLFSVPASPQQGRGQRFDAQIVNGREVVAREALVKFLRPLEPEELNQIRSESDAEQLEPVGRSRLLRVRSGSVDVATLVARFAGRPDVAYAEPNFVVHAIAQPNDISFPQLWGLQNIGQAVNGGLPGVVGADIHATQAWDLSVGSTANVVAVIDTGVDYRHLDLADNMWSAPSTFNVSMGNRSIKCAAGTHGFNAIRLTCDPMDDHNHGTHVAGTIGATGNNNLGVVGVNWTTSLMGVKFLDANGSGTIADAINAIDFVIQAKQAFAATGGANVRILSNSWGDTSFSQALLDAVNAANAADMLFVAGAGNYGISNEILPFYPASYDAPNVVAVAATDNTDNLAWFSNYGASSVHLAAPGVDILSTTIGDTYAFASGTSMATPHVSGAAALVLSRCALDTAALKDTIMGSVELAPALASTTIAGGRLDVNNAIHACIAPPETPTGLTALGGDRLVTLAWSSAPGATSYNMKRSTVSGGPYTPIASGIKGARYSDTTVINGTTYYYVVSAANTLGESGDSNEASATPKTPSDVIVSSLTVPVNVGAGTTIAVSVTTKNQGAGTADPSITRFYLSANAAFDSGDMLFGGAQAVPELAPGTVNLASVSVDIPADLPVGSWYLIAKADADNVLNESQETNNTYVRLLMIGPDLIMSSLTVPTTAAAGATVSVTDTVKNQGGGAAGASTTRFYLSANALLDAADMLLDAGRAVPELAAGASSSGSTPLTIPSGTAVGTYYLFAKADADAVVVETQETNNTSPRAIQIGGDLVVSSLTVPAWGGAGATISVTDTVKNQGAGAATASTTRFYLSTNASLDAADVLLAGGRSVPELAPGASSSGPTTVMIPSPTAVGAYYVIAQADGDNTAPETNELNNTAARGIQIGSDLVVSAFTVPAKGGAGSVIGVSDTTTNQGTGTAAASVTRFYLSANALLDAADMLLDAGRAVPELAAGASSSGSTTVTIPSGTAAGTYYLFAKADADAAVVETQETNNTSVRAIQIGGDLTVSAFTMPSKGGPGASIVVTDTTTNQGGGAIMSVSVTAFYLSMNTLLDALDVPLDGSRAIGALAAGAASSGSTTVTIPGGIAPGTYYVIAKADADSTLMETQEGNNTTVRVITIGPDLTISSLSVTSSIAAGSTVTVGNTVANGGADAAGPSTTRFYLSSNVSLDASDIPLAESRAVPALAGGASSAGSTLVTIPAGTAPGNYYLLAKADADGAVTETQEANNVTARFVQVTGGP